MHELAFADAVRPTQVRCLGLPLLPYSIGHEILLLQARNPTLTCTPAEFGALDFSEQRRSLMRAVLVCSNTWVKNNHHQRWLRLWNWKIRNANFSLEMVEFRNYLYEAHAGFPGPDAEADSICAKATGYAPLSEARGRCSGAPLISRLMDYLVPDWASKETVFDFPFGFANMLYESSLESDGSGRIENREEFEEKENLAKIRSDVFSERESLTGLATPLPNFEPATGEKT